MKRHWDRAGPTLGYEELIEAPLRNTLNLPVSAGRLLRIHSMADVLAQPALRDGWLSNPEVLILGGGSNILFVSERIEQAMMLNSEEHGAIETPDFVRAYADAGVALDQWVRWTAAQGWYGLERLAEIPGTVGAAPIQNVGAYGVQLSDVLDAVALWDRHKQEHVVWQPEACGLGYRHSRFKEEPDRWLVLRVWVRLRRNPPEDWPPLGYPGLQPAAERYLDASGRRLSSLTPLELAEIVTQVRRQKLPDWRSPKTGSVGSFFQNPIVSPTEVARLKAQWPEMPSYPIADAPQCKLSAGWLIEQAGWRGKSLGAAGMSAEHALVLVNLGGASGHELWQVAQQVQADVLRRFGIQLHPEPRIIP